MKRNTRLGGEVRDLAQVTDHRTIHKIDLGVMLLSHVTQVSLVFDRISMMTVLEVTHRNPGMTVLEMIYNRMETVIQRQIEHVRYVLVVGPSSRDLHRQVVQRTDLILSHLHIPRTYLGHTNHEVKHICHQS